ncbi:NAD(P)-binding protein [Hymenopellis radicata]|nr:NAD(P)-binding protein [Hymenopellis radicata]
MSSPSSQLVWLITGTSSGIGRELVIAALKRGDKVIATARARSISQLEDLKSAGADVLELDVTSSVDEIGEAAKKAIAIHGRIDVLVNNAGELRYSFLLRRLLVGAIEDNTAQETLNIYQTNLFGGINVARAFLPYMRPRKSGTLVWIGSVGGWIPAPMTGVYASAKHALRGISETLDQELAPLGLRSICMDFGTFRTGLIDTTHHVPYTARIDDYRAPTEAFEKLIRDVDGKQPGDTRKAVEIIVDVVRGEGVAKGRAGGMPSFLLLGSDCFEMAQKEVKRVMRMQEEWADVSKSTDF